MKNAQLLYKYVYLLLGALIGGWHFYFGTISIFVFHENEPFSSWLIVVSGPILTLPAYLVGIIKPRISCWCFLLGSTLSLFLMCLSEGFHGSYLVRFFVYINLPMYTLAAMNLMRSKRYAADNSEN